MYLFIKSDTLGMKNPLNKRTRLTLVGIKGKFSFRVVRLGEE